ncbi:DinB family protein [Alicyclobacillus curvatus]|jgi:uncharacterized damage-inducible protein DinB|nr:DinB family protein [Alicyclobacillus curvatus]
MSEALKMYHYHVWANTRVFDHLAQLPADVLRAPLQSVFPTIADALAHMYIVDNLWLTAMSGQAADIYRLLPTWEEEVKDATVDTFQSRFSEVAGRYEMFLAHQKDLQSISEYPHPRHGTLRASYSDIVHHIANHGTYHRGNITAMLRQLGHAGPSTDYVFYLYTI